MKGFIYLLEIAVAAMLVVIVLVIFFAVKIKLNWERSDLIAVGNDMLNSLKQGGKIIDILNGDVTPIENVSSVNIGYGLKITGSPKSKIEVGCISYCDYIDSLLTDSYVNAHWINFTVEPFDINTGIPDYLDAVVFVNYTGYGTQKTKIDEYLSKGGIVIGINATYSLTDSAFNSIFNLTAASSGGDLHFTPYNPSQDDIEKYFLGFGFDVSSTWYVWEQDWNVFYIGLKTINITRGTTFRVVNEGENFNLTSPVDSNVYWFKVKKIWYPTRTDIQPLNTTFVFKSFTDSLSVKSQNINILKKIDEAAMTSNNSAIWISDFPWSDEYRTLVKAAIASRKDEWYVKQPYPTKETTEVSSFVSLCCDMPETPELTFILWYKV